MKRLGWPLPLALAAVLALPACTSPDRPTVQADPVALPTPLQSFDASMAATIRELEVATALLGVRLDPAVGAYRPSEPASLLQLPRVVLRADLADTDVGFVVVYQADSPGLALDRAHDLADYLGSGFGQTNYTADTQFSVGVLDDTVVFTTWASGRSDDPASAQAVFDAVGTVGEPVEVNK